MKKLIIVIMILSGIIPIHAQNMLEDFKGVRATFSDLSYFNAKIRVRTDGFSEGNVDAEINKSEHQFLNKVGENTLLVSTEYVVIVNDLEKSIIVNKRPDDEVVDDGFAGLAPLPEFDLPYEYLGEDGLGKHYRIVSKGAEIESTEIWIDPASHFIRRIEYRYAGQDVLTVVDYYQLDTAPTFDSDFFAIDQFVVMEKESMVPSKAYAGYHVINNAF